MIWWVFTRADDAQGPELPTEPCARCALPLSDHTWTCQTRGCNKPLGKGGSAVALHTYRDHKPGMRHSSTALLTCPSRSQTSLEEARAYLAAHGGLVMPGQSVPIPTSVASSPPTAPLAALAAPSFLAGGLQSPPSAPLPASHASTLPAPPEPPSPSEGEADGPGPTLAPNPPAAIPAPVTATAPAPSLPEPGAAPCPVCKRALGTSADCHTCGAFRVAVGGFSQTLP